MTYRHRLIPLAVAGLALPFAVAAMEPDQQHLEAAFHAADPDNGGTVDMKEAQKFGLAKEASDAANPDKDGSLDQKEFAAALAWQFRKADPDKDGTLDRKEASKAGVKTKKAFEMADPDKDGTLDMAEYVKALTQQAGAAGRNMGKDLPKQGMK